MKYHRLFYVVTLLDLFFITVAPISRLSFHQQSPRVSDDTLFGLIRHCQQNLCRLVTHPLIAKALTEEAQMTRSV